MKTSKTRIKKVLRLFFVLSLLLLTSTQSISAAESIGLGNDESTQTEEGPAGDVTISGTFDVNQYVITYIIDGEVFATDIINYGESITVPEVPARGGYTFAWVDEVPETMSAKDIVINGAYTIIADVSHVVAKDEILYICTVDGQRVNKLRQGLNIVWMKDGNVRKIFIK